jgi:hypothetical protein
VVDAAVRAAVPKDEADGRSADQPAGSDPAI